MTIMKDLSIFDLLREEALEGMDDGEVHFFIRSPFGTHEVEVSYDPEEDEVFAVVGFMLPDDMYAETENGTYGTLQGFRVFSESSVTLVKWRDAYNEKRKGKG